MARTPEWLRPVAIGTTAALVVGAGLYEGFKFTQPNGASLRVQPGIHSSPLAETPSPLVSATDRPVAIVPPSTEPSQEPTPGGPTRALPTPTSTPDRTPTPAPVATPTAMPPAECAPGQANQQTEIQTNAPQEIPAGNGKVTIIVDDPREGRHGAWRLAGTNDPWQIMDSKVPTILDTTEPIEVEGGSNLWGDVCATNPNEGKSRANNLDGQDGLRAGVNIIYETLRGTQVYTSGTYAADEDAYANLPANQMLISLT